MTRKTPRPALRRLYRLCGRAYSLEHGGSAYDGSNPPAPLTSLTAPLLVILLIFAIAGAGN